jgi:uncharacterized protein (DUF58 family)
VSPRRRAGNERTREPLDVRSTVAPAERLARLELEVTRRLDGLVHGDFLGVAVGPGSEPSDARPYAPGDDARWIDWNLTARSAAVQTRLTEPDRELELWLLADVSPSLDFGTARVEKRDLVLAAAAAFGLRTLGHGNRVGLMIVGDGPPRIFPARSDRSSVLAALSALATHRRRDCGSDHDADLRAGLERMRRISHRRGVVVVMSDFLERTPWPRALAQVALHHDVVAVHVVDPRELALPSVGMVAMVDAETGAVIDVQTHSAPLRERYATAARARHDAIAAELHAAGAWSVELSTDRDWVLDLARFFARSHPRRVQRSPLQRRSHATTSGRARSGAEAASR